MTDEPESQASGQAFPPGLHDRGRVLWLALGQQIDTPGGQLALEACRSADRLDELDSVIAGKGVLKLMQFRLRDIEWDGDGDHHVHIDVSFQNVLAEARQQQANFKALLVDLSKVAGGAAPAPGATTKPTPTSPLDELEQRRAGRS